MNQKTFFDMIESIDSTVDKMRSYNDLSNSSEAGQQSLMAIAMVVAPYNLELAELAMETCADLATIRDIASSQALSVVHEYLNQVRKNVRQD